MPARFADRVWFNLNSGKTPREIADNLVSAASAGGATGVTYHPVPNEVALEAAEGANFRLDKTPQGLAAWNQTVTNPANDVFQTKPSGTKRTATVEGLAVTDITDMAVAGDVYSAVVSGFVDPTYTITGGPTNNYINLGIYTTSFVDGGTSLAEHNSIAFNLPNLNPALESGDSLTVDLSPFTWTGSAFGLTELPTLKWAVGYEGHGGNATILTSPTISFVLPSTVQTAVTAVIHGFIDKEGNVYPAWVSLGTVDGQFSLLHPLNWDDAVQRVMNTGAVIP